MINIYPIGIMQGRVAPKTLERLQVFPEQWEEEFRFAKEIGFDHIELLDDKESRLRDLLNTQKQEFFARLSQSQLECTSVCADQLCSYSLLQNPEKFKEMLGELLSLLEGHGIFTIVVPFFDENKIHSTEELKKAMKELSSFDQELAQKGMQLALEIDLPAEDIMQGFEGYAFSSLGVCYDIGNGIGNGFPVGKEIRTLGNLIAHVHVKDKQNGKNVRLGAHPKELGDAFCALKEIGYEGLLTLETCITPDPVVEAAMNLAATKKLMQGIQL